MTDPSKSRERSELVVFGCSGPWSCYGHILSE